MTANEPPADLLTALPEGSASAARRWWESLSDADRGRIADLWDERLEVKFFAPQTDDEGHADGWEQVPAVVGGRFVPSDHTRGFPDLGPGYFEYLLSDPDLILAYEPASRTFHYACTRHAAAQACRAAGRVPADFQCPVGAATCPLEPLRGACLVKPDVVRVRPAS
jgi:hypothetical protein